MFMYLFIYVTITKRMCLEFERELGRGNITCFREERDGRNYIIIFYFLKIYNF